MKNYIKKFMKDNNLTHLQEFGVTEHGVTEGPYWFSDDYMLRCKSHITEYTLYRLLKGELSIKQHGEKEQRIDEIRLINKNRNKLEELTNPIMDYIRENYNPHTQITISGTTAEIFEGKEGIVNVYFPEKFSNVLNKVTFTKYKEN